MRLLSEGVHRVAWDRGAQMRLQPSAINDVEGSFEQAGDVFLEAHIVVDGAFGTRFELHQDVDVALGPLLAARNRAE
jgi:hypothetical protein